MQCEHVSYKKHYYSILKNPDIRKTALQLNGEYAAMSYLFHQVALSNLCGFHNDTRQVAVYLLRGGVLNVRAKEFSRIYISDVYDV